jgi:hypothetical protein
LNVRDGSNSWFKTITVGNANGDYFLVCNMKVLDCLGKDHYVFNKNTKWKMTGARDYITLACCRIGTVTYTHGENISLFPAEGAAGRM